jgi:hypothetical protein
MHAKETTDVRHFVDKKYTRKRALVEKNKLFNYLIMA